MALLGSDSAVCAVDGSPKRQRVDDFQNEGSLIGISLDSPNCRQSNVQVELDPKLDATPDAFGKVSRIAVDAAVAFLRRQSCDASSLDLLPDAEQNRRKLYDLLSETACNACNNSALLLGPRGCGKTVVLNRVVDELQEQYPGRICAVWLSGLLHTDDHCALKAIAKQLCAEHDLMFSKSASFEENSQFLTSMLREYSLSHKSVIFVLDDFDLFAQIPKQKLLYNLLNILQSTDSQAAVVGISCRLDADQLLEKRVRSRFSHRKFLFLPPVAPALKRFFRSALSLPTDSRFPFIEYAEKFNAEVIGFLSISNFKAAIKNLRRQPKLDSLRDVAVLELYLLVSMKRLEGKDRETYNFTTIFKEYKCLHDTHNTCDLYSQDVCLRAFENLLERQLIAFVDGRNHRNGIEFRSVKLLVSSFEIEEGLKTSPVCPMVLHQWCAHEGFK
eukprot:c21067_g1_i2 orf=228-1559(-)